MAKSNHFPGLLLLALVCIHFCIASDIIKNKEQRARIKDVARLPIEVSSFKGISEDRVARVKKIYDSQVGVRERGNNSGPQVEKYLQYVGLAKGQPWCAAFVCWALGTAGIENPRSGWSPNLFRSAKVIWEREPRTKNQESRLPQNAQGGISVLSNSFSTPVSQLVTRNWQPNAGDVFGIYFPEKKRIAHVGFIDSWDGKWLVTVEGNTNISGDREGDGVYRKRRPIRSIYRVARYIN